jgi:hypothetical protein
LHLQGLVIMIFLFYFPLLSSRSCILPVYLIVFCVFNKILLTYQKKKKKGYCDDLALVIMGQGPGRQRNHHYNNGKASSA